MGGHSLGGASNHINAIGFSPFPQQMKFYAIGFWARHALGRELHTKSEKKKKIIQCILNILLH